MVRDNFDNDKEALRHKLIPISYDLSLSHMGLSMEDSLQMKDTNIVIHCAATSEYENSLEWSLEVCLFIFYKTNSVLTKIVLIVYRQMYWEQFD